MEIQEFIKKFALQFEESEVENINELAEFKQLETWDSLTSMSVQVMIEDEYNVKITPDDLKRTKKVIDLYNFVDSKCNSNG